MPAALTHLDQILRGDATRPERLRENSLGEVPLVRLTLMLILLAATYGACMGLYAVTGAGNGDWRQIASSAAKVPTLFVLTLVVTLPSLYVFNALLGSRLTFPGILRLTIAAMGVTMAVLSSIGPIVAFFSVTTSSYPFMLLLNVFVLAISGLLGLAFLKQTLNRLAALEPRPAPAARTAEDFADTPVSVEQRLPAAIDRPSGTDAFASNTRAVFSIWMIVFGLVGAQMAWILRPFLGSPGLEFAWFRERGSNFFVAVWNAIEQLSK